jgi:hypothetical protein
MVSPRRSPGRIPLASRMIRAGVLTLWIALLASALQTQYWYREMVRNRRYGATGLAMLPVKAIDTLQPLYGLTALALLLSYAFRGRLSVLAPALGVIIAKIMIDLTFQIWAMHLYRRWAGTSGAPSYRRALAASLVEPFTFRILRHAGATWGWVAFLRGRQTWDRQRRASHAQR